MSNWTFDFKAAFSILTRKKSCDKTGFLSRIIMWFYNILPHISVVCLFLNILSCEMVEKIGEKRKENIRIIQFNSTQTICEKFVFYSLGNNLKINTFIYFFPFSVFRVLILSAIKFSCVYIYTKISYSIFLKR